MNRYKALLLTALLINAGPTLAQEDDRAQATEGEARQEQRKEAEDQERAQTEAREDAATEEDASARNQRRDTFVPSEEISEDLSVSFPVDI